MSYASVDSITEEPARCLVKTGDGFDVQLASETLLLTSGVRDLGHLILDASLEPFRRSEAFDLRRTSLVEMLPAETRVCLLMFLVRFISFPYVAVGICGLYRAIDHQAARSLLRRLHAWLWPFQRRGRDREEMGSANGLTCASVR